MSGQRRVHAGAEQRGRSLLAATMVGVGLVAAVDQAVFHQILAWHHFYDWSTVRVALLWDGVLHAGELALIVPGFLLLKKLEQRQVLSPRSAWAGVFLGMGGFQLFDGLVVHKVLRLHQIRYDVEALPYDIAWNAAAVVLLAVGVALAVSRVRPAAVEEER